jgi:LysR family hydrogen peroxide-inducible transcriptional activator
MSLAGLSLRDLEYVVAVAELRHFGRAAERCGVSQPSLSAQIRRLEEMVGLSVFERTPRNVRLTARGEIFVRQARQVLAEAQRLLELCREAGGPLSGTFRLGLLPTIGPYLLPYILKPLKQRWPALNLLLIEARTPDLVRDLRAGELDVAVLSPVAGCEGLKMFELFFERFLLVHPPELALAKRAELSVEDLDAPGLLLLEEGHCLRDQALSLCARAHPSRRHATGLEMLKQMVAAGEGFSIVPALAATIPAGLEGLLAFTPLSGDGAGRRLAVACRPSDPRADEIEKLAALIADMTPHGDLPAGTKRHTAPTQRRGKA